MKAKRVTHKPNNIKIKTIAKVLFMLLLAGVIIKTNDTFLFIASIFGFWITFISFSKGKGSNSDEVEDYDMFDDDGLAPTAYNLYVNPVTREIYGTYDD